MTAQVILATNDGRGTIGELAIATVNVSQSMRNIRSAIELQACRKFGKEGRDWRMIGDQSVFGCYARSTLGDAITLR